MVFWGSEIGGKDVFAGFFLPFSCLRMHVKEKTRST